MNRRATRARSKRAGPGHAGWIAAAILLLPSPAPAYDLAEIDGDSVPGNAPIVLGWEARRFPLPFLVDRAPPGGVDPAAYSGAVRAAFAAWEDASQGAARFALEDAAGRGEPAALRAASLAPDDCATEAECLLLVQVVGADWAGTTGSTRGVIGLTLVKFHTGSRRMLDADILLNDESHDFATDARATAFDVQGILTHEVGHALGVGHPENASRADSTMWAVTPPGNLGLRSLDPDDQNAVRYLYAPLEFPVPGPDNNLFGLIARAGAEAGGGCRAGGSRGTLSASFVGLLLGLLGILARAQVRRL